MTQALLILVCLLVSRLVLRRNWAAILAVWAFYISLAGRQLFKDSVLD
ncbi:MAG: hypothetical protein QNL91_10950 [Candidatus Krumholzibacteria bacterium]|nr:hypothetical protein [Candidatus Krumholzibacteria bacterium]